MVTTIILGLAIFMSVVFMIGITSAYIHGILERVTVNFIPDYIVLAIVSILWSVFYYLNL